MTSKIMLQNFLTGLMQVLTEAPSQVSKVQPCGDSSQVFLKTIRTAPSVLTLDQHVLYLPVSITNFQKKVNCKLHKLRQKAQIVWLSPVERLLLRSPLSEMVATCTWWTIALAQAERNLGHLFFVHQNLADAIRPFSPSSAKCIKLRIQLILRLWQCSLKDVLGKLAGEALQ